jgi:hypothetical protein
VHDGGHLQQREYVGPGPVAHGADSRPIWIGAPRLAPEPELCPASRGPGVA